MLAHDYFMYVVVTSQIAKRMRTRFEQKYTKNPLVVFIEHLGKTRYFLPLLISKFVYGARIALIIYGSAREKKAGTFLFYNALAVALWFAIMMPIGWFAGRGFIHLLQVARGLEKVLAVTLFFFLLVFLIHSMFKRLASKKKR